MGCKICTINKREVGNNTNKQEQGAKDVESVTKSTRRGEFWKRIISEEEEICARRAEKYEKNNKRNPRLL